MTDDQITQAAQLIAQGDFMEAMKIFENFIESNPDDPAGYHGWAEAALFEIQVNGNFDEKGNDRINEGQVAAYYRRLHRWIQKTQNIWHPTPRRY